jgi:hypothetical protein
VVNLGDLKIPAASQQAAEGIITLTDLVCVEHLDEEYADLARRMVGKLARKRPSPILSGRPNTWAGAVVYALGQVNFLFDKSIKPYATADDLAEWFGASKNTLGSKAKQIRDGLRIGYASIEFQREDVVDATSMAWFIQVDGLIYDARDLVPEIQMAAYERGLIPYIPALGREGTALWAAAEPPAG